jgi:hypothetical protein
MPLHSNQELYHILDRLFCFLKIQHIGPLPSQSLTSKYPHV